jgi:tetratricopeptide (TPR) repeat protein
VSAVVDLSRIEELRRRIQKDPASIAFAQLGEEYRRAGRFEDAIETCRAGLAYHPGYLSAYVTLGRALIETGDLGAATEALSRVHAAAPDNLAAIKGLADIRHRLGDCEASLALYDRALELAPHDPELEHLVGAVTADLAARASAPQDPPAGPPDFAVGLETAAEPAGEAASRPLEAAAPGTPAQIEALERWLDTVLADRDSRK